jgi:drug/metabolite transporter (DMT)-like permease
MSPPDRASPSGALPPAAIALMIVLSALWGLNVVVVKVTSSGIPPVLQAGLRSALAALLVPLLCRPLGLGFGKWRGGGTLAVGIFAGVLFAVEFVALYIGIGLTTAARAVVFLYGAPFWVTLGTHYLVPGDRLTRAKATGLCVAFGGLLLAFADGLRAPAGPDAQLGDLLCLIGGALWAATTVLVKASSLRAAPPALVLQYQLMVSAPLLLLASPLFGEAWAIQPSPLVLGAFLYQVAGIAGASYLAWFWLVSRHSASRLAAFSVLTPVFGVLAGALLLDEALGVGFLAAVALVALGLWLVNRPAR